ncbi:GIY-YIG nuclease family protein [Cohaesibacter celericrescens]|uniref:Bacteriophage T5 Orf172 DNA-binding domain-containing protein n=1 Tax=Cohaesibacter celericrescens TaxID=2067669 RepID=A0A2N5XT70_9HYPH|nr:GIY-YIG nuclease family protein [Cohaesibacter celericrescens]PLW77680.1 hypothetical protein C0081_10350 [Cohaesibacter celericrescens]
MRIFESKPLTKGNLKNNHIYITPFRDELPDDIVGGSTKDNPATHLITLEYDSETVDTYVPTTTKGVVRSFFHARGFVHTLFEQSGAQIGDIILFEEVAPYHLRLSLKAGSKMHGHTSPIIAEAEDYASYFEANLSDKEELALIYHAMRGKVSMGDLASHVGYDSYEPMNALYGRLGHKISDEFNLNPHLYDGKPVWISIISAWNKSENTTDRTFRSYLHEEVIQGMHLAGLLSEEDLEIALIMREHALSKQSQTTKLPSNTHAGKIFFTYVWGAPGDPTWPLTFATKAARTHAKKVLSEGDIVFTVGTKTDPTAPEFKGRVVGVYQVSDMEVNTRDYVGGLPTERHDDSVVERFPYALHPLKVWQIDQDDNLFSDLVGPLTGRHHLQARDTVVELDALTAEPLLALSKSEVSVAEPTTLLGMGRLAKKKSKLAPKHEGEYSGTFNEHDVWYVYILALRNERKQILAFKIGYSHCPQDRVDAHNKPIATEVTGLSWCLLMTQPMGNEDQARDAEQSLLKKFSGRCLESNGEIVSGVQENAISSALAEVLRER